MNIRFSLFLLLILLIFPCSVFSEEFTGVRGRTAIKGEKVGGVTVFTFDNPDDLIHCRTPVATGTSDAEGLFTIRLRPGRYLIVGYRGKQKCPLPSPGELFSFYGGNPVVVERGKPTNVGLAMVKVKPDPGKKGVKGISGYVYDEEGEPIDGAVAYFYKNADGGLRGIPDYFTRTNEKGTFRARIGKGSYFIVVRKRQDGEVFGPTQIGDLFGYYPRNPFVYDGVSDVTIRVDAVMRLSQLEKFEGFEEVTPGILISGVLMDTEGNPVSGYFVFAYRGNESIGMPDSISGKSDGEGRFELTVFDEGKYSLVARLRPGGPLDKTPSGTAEIRVEQGESLESVIIVVGGNK